MKKVLLASILSTLMAVPVLACANDYNAGVGFDSTSINGMSLPAGQLSVSKSFGDYAAKADITGGSGNGMSFYGAQVGAGKHISFDTGMAYVGLMGGYERLGYSAGHLSAAYAGADVGYLYPLSRNIAVSVNGGFGRDFATSATTDSHTTGGLFYKAGAALDFANVGPGVVDVSFNYQHLPISESHDLHLNTRTYGIGYKMSF